MYIWSLLDPLLWRQLKDEFYKKPEDESTHSHQHSNRFWSASRKPAVSERSCLNVLYVQAYFSSCFFFGIDNPQRITQQAKSHELWREKKSACVWKGDVLVLIFFFSSSFVWFSFFNLLFGAAVHVFIFFGMLRDFSFDGNMSCTVKTPAY